ncbi:ACR3 family arsenite efflux transporter [Ferrimonas balearica]|uniref:ACR3 family arsenite efflux transporter n=1 Tax=Ferrimonas balearica TaxID=44012 RepID=UPI001C996CA7|nr:ACR3 family arsenite efflux transporter [Ferrimonas balearica]MBY5923157.1 ACR3 family arsenite efflux transporter [Ferrimonas balearica]MBY5997467.1 ACR3 family arsenite efflux transporter [Ferrimonas balearica]
MGNFERYLSVWVGLAIAAGVALGHGFPALFETLAQWQMFQINGVIAVLIWVMIYPMMIQVDFKSIRKVGQQPQGLWLTLAINWLIKPFSMAAIGWLFFNVFFADLVSPSDASQYIAGMILLGVAPCTAMVFVWSQLTRGNPAYTLVQVSVNDLIMVFAFAPIAALLLGVSDIIVPWETLLLATLLYVVLPLVAGVLTRHWLLKRSEQALNRYVDTLKPASMVGLLATVLILFGIQAPTLLANPFVIGLIAIPLLLQTYGIFALAYGAAKVLKLPHNVAAPAAMIGTSNFFELAVAVAIALFGLHSGAALATVVGVLVEVPVMLSLVAFANRTRHWFPESASAPDDFHANAQRDAV